MAEEDTRLFESWREEYRDKQSKKIDPNKDICFFTEVRDSTWNYEGTNLLVDCDHASNYRSQVYPRPDGNYGGPKVSYFF